MIVSVGFCHALVGKLGAIHHEQVSDVVRLQEGREHGRLRIRAHPRRADLVGLAAHAVGGGRSPADAFEDLGGVCGHVASIARSLSRGVRRSRTTGMPNVSRVFVSTVTHVVLVAKALAESLRRDLRRLRLHVAARL